MAYRILHLADLHLDTSFSGCGFPTQLASRRREGLRETFKRVLDMAVEMNLDAITIGGDLYEAERSRMDTAEFIRGQLARVAPIPVLVSPGNHDHCSTGSFYRLDSWPQNVHIFHRSQLEPFTLPNGPTVWGAGHESPSFGRDLLAGLSDCEGGSNVLLMHGTDRTMVIDASKGAHCPFDPAAVRRCGLELALLGHIHRPRVTRVGDAILCYPGSVEPLGFDETGDHGVAVAEHDGTSWSVATIPAARWQYRHAELDITGFRSRDEVSEKLLSLWPEVKRRDTLIARVALVGTAEPSLELDAPYLAESCRSGYAHVAIEDASLPPYDYEALSREPTATGLFVRMMTETMQSLAGDDLRKHQRALQYGLEALGGREVRLR